MIKRGVKGQVSLFMVIAGIILIAVGLLLFLRSNFPEVSSQDIPDELLPVQVFVNECLERVGKEAVLLAGAQGGYTQIPDDIANDPEAFIPLMGQIKLPFWYRNNKNAAPSNSEVESEIGGYVERKLSACLAEFRPLKELYSISVLTSPAAAVAIKDGSVDIGLSYSLSVGYMHGTGRLDNFRAEIPIGLGKILRLARELLNAENRQAWLEQRTIDLMASLPDNRIPFTSIAFSCVPLAWNMETVESELQQLLKFNLPRVRIKKTNFMPFEKPLNYYANPASPYPSDVAEYAMLLWDPLKEEFSNLRTAVGYLPAWGMSLDARPSTDGQMRSHSVEGGSYNLVDLTGACIQFYHFTYDITYPARISIYDDKSDYSFSYAFPVIIRNNQGWRSSEPFSATDLSEFDDFCSDLEDTERSVFVQDAKTYDKLRNVSLSFSCIRYVCRLGQTDEQNGRLVTELPAGCYGGILSAEKNGYLKSKEQLGDAETTTVYMLPLKNLNVSFLKYDNYSKSYSPLTGEERASLYLSFKGGDQELYSLQLPDTVGSLGIVDSDAIYKLRLYIFDGETLTGGYSLDNWVPGDLSGKTRVEFFGYNFAGEDQSDILRRITRNSTALEPSVR